MNYKKIIEEQIEILREEQNEMKALDYIGDKCKVAETIARLTQTASVFPETVDKPTDKQTMFEKAIPKVSAPPIATYIYHDEFGNEIFRKYRFEDKKFYIEGNPQPILYNLPCLIEAIKKNEAIFIVEGEKDVETLRKLGLTATTNYDGPSCTGKSKWLQSYNKYFEGANVILIPDNDVAGRKHMEDITLKLRGITKCIRTVVLEDIPERGDISDWIEASHTTDQLLMIILKAIPKV